MTIEALIPRVRKALGVNASYEADEIPGLINDACNRLLRDYHFPKAVKRETYGPAVGGETSFALPAGFKKELEVRYYDPNGAAYSDPLIKRERFQLPYPTGVPYYYWLEGANLLVDTPYSAAMIGYSTFVWYESMDVDGNLWLTDDFPAAVRYLAITRGCAEFRKPEVMQVYAPLWQDEQQSLAIYLNELEWNNAEMMMREARPVPSCRYPA